MRAFWFTFCSFICAATAAMYAHDGNPIWIFASVSNGFTALLWLRDR